MGYNALSGTVIAYPGSELRAGTLNATDISGSLISGSVLYGNGAQITEVPRIVANASADNLLTVGSNANSMVGEPNLTFNGSVLNLNGALTASTGVSASVYYGDGSKLTGITASGGGGSANAQGPTYSVQFNTGSGGISGSAGLLYSGSTFTVTGTMNMSGTINLDGDLIPAAANLHDLGSSAKPWRDLYISASSIHFGSEVLSVSDNNLKFGSGSTTKGFDVGFMNFKNNGIFMDPGKEFQLRAYQLRFYGGIAYVRRVVAASYTIQVIDYLIGIQSNDLTGSITLTLPLANTLQNGQTFVIKDEGGAVNTHPVTITCSGSNTIDGQNSVVLESPYSSIQVYCNGIGKYFIS
jgi:hypothetical protein